MAKNIIKLNRGDSKELPVDIPNGSMLSESLEAIYFALMYPNQPIEEALLLKGYAPEDLNNSELVIKIKPEDTKQLAPGIYYYTIKLHKGSTADLLETLRNPVEVRTLVERTKFIINE